MIQEVKRMDEYNPKYTKNGALKWQRINEGKHKKKEFPTIPIEKLMIGKIKVDEENLKSYRRQYEQTHEFIPVLIRNYDYKLKSGYESIVLAQELGMTEVPYIMHGEKGVARKPYCNKRTPVMDCTGRKIYVTKIACDKISECKNICSELGLTLEILPSFRFCVRDKEGTSIWKQEDFTLNTVRDRLRRKIRNIRGEITNG